MAMRQTKTGVVGWLLLMCAGNLGCSDPVSDGDSDDASGGAAPAIHWMDSDGTSSSSTTAGGGGSGSSGSTRGGNFAGESTAEVIGHNGEPGACRALQIESGCAGQLYEGELIKLDLYVMFDQSGSMATVIDNATGEQRIDAVASAMQDFLLDWESAGIGVGLGHFGHFPLGETSCNEGDYAKPLVSIERLPDNAEPVLDSLMSLEPIGETPTAAGIRGACAVTSERKAEYPATIVANLLVTDGEPKAPASSKKGDCNPTLDDAVAAASECAALGVPTYVLGVGPSLDNLNKIAEAGQTEGAHLVAHDSSQGVLDALNEIRGQAQAPCEIEVRASESGPALNLSETDVVFMDDECVVRRVARVENAAACDNSSGGWYFAESGDERSIVLCERSCADVRQPEAEFFYSIGCGIETIY